MSSPHSQVSAPPKPEANIDPTLQDYSGDLQMNIENVFIPLSPPSSPHMSAFGSATGVSAWQERHIKAQLTPTSSDNGMTSMTIEESSFQLQDNQRRPLLRTHKSFPYSLGPASRTGHGSSTPLTASGSPKGRITISELGDEPESADLLPPTFGGSAPTSPVSRLTPTSPEKDQTNDGNDSSQEDIVDFDIGMDDGDQEEQKVPMTAAELRAQKRKMKRFRLTHNQTRFLMSEFARQAHPDAAHRERLAREIPGLTPRQVQVWFQNRRAKLKRLTSDDRERMMRSRALPDDFDMSQALHSPFGAGSNATPPMISPITFSTYPDSTGMTRPLTLDTLRSPAGITSAYGGYTFTPPQSATDTGSPVSVTAETSPFGFPTSSIMDASPRRSNPFVTGVSSAASYATHPSIPRLQLQDRVGRSRAESMNSPLRSSLSYTSMSGLSDDSAVDTGSYMDQTATTRGMTSSSMYNAAMGYNNYNPVPGFSNQQSRMRSFSNNIPRRIELSSHYTASRSNSMSVATPQTATFPSYQTNTLATSSAFQNLNLSAPHNVTSFNPSSYMRTDNHDTEPFPAFDESRQNPRDHHHGSMTPTY